jgi:hypothetical protein
VTPEGAVKNKVKRLLATYGKDLWYDMPVPGGYGKPTLDFIGCYRGYFFAIETKAGRGKLTPRQELTKKQMERACGKVFVVNENMETLREVNEWLADPQGK